MKHCKHYSWNQGPTCSSGINIMERFGPQIGWAKRVPCFGRGTMDCEHCEYPTQEEVEARKTKFKRGFEAMLVVLELIPNKGPGGYVDCPICSNRIHWTRAPNNGHIHAVCQTDSCVEFMQ